MIISTSFFCWKSNFKRSKTIKLCEMFSRVWKSNETLAVVFFCHEGINNQKLGDFSKNGTTPTKMTLNLCTSSLLKAWIDRKIRTSRVCHGMKRILNSQLNSRKNRHTLKMLMRLIRIGEDYGKLKLKRIWMQIGLKRSRTVWVRQEEEITRKAEVSVDEVIRAIDIV